MESERANYFGGITGGDDARRDGTDDHRAGADDAVFADGHALEDDGTAAHEDVVLEHDWGRRPREGMASFRAQVMEVRVKDQDGVPDQAAPADRHAFFGNNLNVVGK